MIITLSYPGDLLTLSSLKNSSIIPEAVLGGFGSDLLIGVLAESTTRATTIDILTVLAVTCDANIISNSLLNISLTPAQATACANGIVPLAIVEVVLTYANGSINWKHLEPPADHVAGLPETLAESIPNYLRGLYSVILVDIGIWSNNSIFVSPATLNATITPNTAISKYMAMHQNTSRLIPAWGSVSQASLILQNQPFLMAPVEDRNPTIIAVNYICHDRKRKGVFSFIICKSSGSHWLNSSLNRFHYLAIIVADLSMFSAFWAVFTAIASYFACRVRNCPPRRV
jgi:hypothetical protein